MADLINVNGLLVSREKELLGYAPVRIGFQVPITDESLRSLAAFAYYLTKGEKEIVEMLGIEPKEIKFRMWSCKPIDEQREAVK